MRPLFVANDMMRDCSNHCYLEKYKARFLGEGKIPAAYQLVLVEGDTGHPYIVEAATVNAPRSQAIHGEIFEVDMGTIYALRPMLGKSNLVGLTVITEAGPVKCSAFVGPSFTMEQPIIIEGGDYRKHKAVLEGAGLKLYRRYSRGTSDPADQFNRQRGKRQWMDAANKTPEEIAQEMNPDTTIDQFKNAVTDTLGTTVGWSEIEPAAMDLIRLANKRMNRDHDGSAPAPEMSEVLSQLMDAMDDPDGRVVTMVMNRLTNPVGEPEQEAELPPDEQPDAPFVEPDDLTDSEVYL